MPMFFGQRENDANHIPCAVPASLSRFPVILETPHILFRRMIFFALFLTCSLYLCTVSVHTIDGGPFSSLCSLVINFFVFLVFLFPFSSYLCSWLVAPGPEEAAPRSTDDGPAKAAPRSTDDGPAKAAPCSADDGPAKAAPRADDGPAKAGSLLSTHPSSPPPRLPSPPPHFELH